jgi:dihydroxyacetone kinase-like protein
MLLRVMRNTLVVMEANSEYLNFLDAQTGDAEHGLSMVRGFRAVNDRLATERYADAAAVLRTTGTVLMETVGGAAGPLYGSLYLKGASAVIGKKDLDRNDLVAFLKAGLAGVKSISRGTEVGDKTMVDALAPASTALEEAARNEKESLAGVLEAAVAAAKEGMASTIGLKAKKGRASYLGERSVGYQDPGATSTYLIIRTVSDTVKRQGCVKVSRYEPSGMITEEIALVD